MNNPLPPNQYNSHSLIHILFFFFCINVGSVPYIYKLHIDYSYIGMLSDGSFSRTMV